jgi:hypothetical protein
MHAAQQRGLAASLGQLLGCFAGIKSTLKSREELLKIASAGPAAGAAVSMFVVLLGLGLSVARAGPLVEVSALHT